MKQIERLVRALNRLDYFDAPADSCPVMVDEDNCFYELLDKSEGLDDDMDGAKQLTLGDLRQLVNEVLNGK